MISTMERAADVQLPSAMPVSRLLLVLVGFPAVSTALSLLLLDRRIFAATGLEFFTVFWLIIIGWYALQIALLSRVLAVSGWRWRDIGFGLDARRTLWLVGAYLVVAFVLLALVELALASAGLDAGKLRALSDLSNLTPRTTVDRLVFIAMGLVAGLCEELVYRGFAIRALQSRGWNRWLAVLAAAVPFVFQHGLKSIDQFWWFLGWGLVFGAIFVWCRRLPVTIAIHWLVILSALLGVLAALR